MPQQQRVAETRAAEVPARPRYQSTEQPPPASPRRTQAEPPARPRTAQAEQEFPRQGARQSPMVAQRQGSAEPFEIPPGALTFEILQDRWRQLVDALRGVGSGGNLDAFLRSVSRPLAIENDETIVIGFIHDFHRDKIDDPKYRHLVEQRFAQLLGKHYTIRCEKVGREETGGHLVRAAQQLGGQIQSGGREQRTDDGERTDAGG